LLVDALIFLALYFAGKYATPTLADDIKIVFGVIQPIILLWIASEFQGENVEMQRGILPTKFQRRMKDG
jgi:hypothetical protein